MYSSLAARNTLYIRTNASLWSSIRLGSAVNVGWVEMIPRKVCLWGLNARRLSFINWNLRWIVYEQTCYNVDPLSQQPRYFRIQGSKKDVVKVAQRYRTKFLIDRTKANE